MDYWQRRLDEAQIAITEKNTKQVEKQLRKYYATVTKQTLEDFENTYNKLLAAIADGKQPTPADLYKLDKYWSLQGQLRQRLQKLGDKQIVALTKAFEANFFEVYYSLNIEGAKMFSTLDEAAVKQMINSIWVADGKSWSQRVWDNIGRLQDTLNEGLIATVASGRKTTELKNILQERFNVSYGRANTLVKTELCHIQTQAAQKRYEDYGIKYVEVLVEDDACDLCKELRGKKFPVNGTPPLPVHPNERCTVLPVLD